MEDSHTAKNLADDLKKCFEEWHIEKKYITGVTDNAKNIINAWELLSKVNIPCVAHTLNLSVGRVLKLSQVSNVLAHARALVKQFHYSTTLAAQLKSKQLMLKANGTNISVNKLLLDCPTRWNSTYDMISRLLDQQLAICAVFVENPAKSDYQLQPKQIRMLEKLKIILKPMKDLTVALSGQSYATISIILPSLFQLVNKHLKSDNDDCNFVMACKDAMRNDLEKRYVDPKIRLVLSAACFLDPRFKHLTFIEDQKPATVEFVKQELLSFCLTNSSAQVKAEVKQEPESQPCVPDLPTLPVADEPNGPPAKVPKVEVDKNIDSDVCDNFMSDIIVVSSNVITPETKVQREIDRYVDAPLDVASMTKNDFSVLNWWKDNSGMFPLMSQLAKKFLCIPASSTPSERVFSLAGNIVTQKRSMLLPENVNKLIFINMNKKYLNK